MSANAGSEPCRPARRTASTRLTILQVLRAPVGGLFRHVADLVEGLAKRGHRVGVIADATTGDRLAEQVFAEMAAHAELGVTRVAMCRQIGYRDITAIAHLRSRLAGQDIAILHGHGAKGGAHARIAARSCGRAMRPAVFYTPHGGSLHFAPRSPAGLVFHNLERLLMPATDGFIFESRFSRDAFAEQIGNPGRRARIIHNGLAEHEFTPVSGNGPEFDFLFVGELRHIKGVDLLIEAMGGLRRPDGRPVRLNIVGGGPQEAQFRDQAARPGRSGDIVFSGVMPARDAFAGARCVVVPSRNESLPYIVLEAAAAGLPLIATGVGGIAEIFGPTAERLVPAEDVPALARAMQEFLDHPERAADEAERRRAYVREEFALPRMIAAIEDFYLETMFAHG